MNQRPKIACVNLTARGILIIGFFTILLITVAFLFVPLRVIAEQGCGSWEETVHPFGNASISIYAKSAGEAWTLAYKWNEPPTPDEVTIGRWDGSTWSNHVSYTRTHAFNDLETPKGIAVFASNDIWIIGNHSEVPISNGWARHWNGIDWKYYTFPSQGSLTINDFDALSSDNIWAVGYDYAGSYSNVSVIQWNGEKWRIVKNKIFTETMDLLTIQVLSKNNIWILGNKGSGDSFRTLAMHKTKTGWEIVPSPNPKPIDHARFRNSSVISSKNIWAVGTYSTGPNEQSFLQRWNGTKWKLRSHPATSFVSNTIAVANKFVWANTNTVIWFWNGSEWYATDATGLAINSAIEGEAWATKYEDGNTKIFHYSSSLPPCPIP